jgi:hypothetical protein
VPEILAAQKWATNADLIVDVASMGYISGRVLDCTYGLGNFWSKWRPEDLTACDLTLAKSPIGYSVDFRKMPFPDESFDVVVFDPPYRLMGTPASKVGDSKMEADFESAYGIDKYMAWKDRYQMIYDGIAECARVLRRKGFLLVKCQNQVTSGQKRWQDLDFTNEATRYGLRLVDQFLMLTDPRPQPEGRRTVHTRQNYSTLLVLRNESKAQIA